MRKNEKHTIILKKAETAYKLMLPAWALYFLRLVQTLWPSEKVVVTRLLHHKGLEGPKVSSCESGMSCLSRLGSETTIRFSLRLRDVWSF